MIAAIHARKSTEQTGAVADATSVASPDRKRALVRGDEGLAGARRARPRRRRRQRRRDAKARQPATLTRRPGTGRPPFQVLVIRDASRFIRRDGDEAFGELKRLAQCRVTVWFYQDGTSSECGNFAANITGIVRAEMNAEFRREIGKWTREATL